MANKTTATQESEVKELVVDGRFVMSSFTRKDGTKVDSVKLEFINPFGDEELFQFVELKARWDRYDEKTGRLVRPDRIFGFMSYYAQKALKTCEEVSVKITIKPVSYISKRTKTKVTYPAIFVDPTFVQLADERPVELIVRDPEKANHFELLASLALGINFTDKSERDPDDIGL